MTVFTLETGTTTFPGPLPQARVKVLGMRLRRAKILEKTLARLENNQHFFDNKCDLYMEDIC